MSLLPTTMQYVLMYGINKNTESLWKYSVEIEIF